MTPTQIETSLTATLTPVLKALGVWRGDDEVLVENGLAVLRMEPNDLKVLLDRLAEVTPRLPEAHCGLNADWNCRAWCVRGSLKENASVFVLDDEDGTYSLVQRYFARPDTDDAPSACHWGADDDWNDYTHVILSGMTEADAARCLGIR